MAFFPSWKPGGEREAFLNLHAEGKVFFIVLIEYFVIFMSYQNVV